MADGSHLAIDLITPGDRVLAYNVASQTWRPQTVLDQWSTLDVGYMTQLTLTDGANVDATDHHRFWVESDQTWTDIDSLHAGDVLLSPAGEVIVDQVSTGELAFTTVYELTVEGDHNFTVQAGDHDLLVHNCGDDDDDDDRDDDDLSLIHI